MERRTVLKLAVGGLLGASAGTAPWGTAQAANKEIVYLTPGLDLPFWRYLSKGVEAAAKEKGYGYTALDSHNSAQTQLAERPRFHRTRRRRNRDLADRFLHLSRACSRWPRRQAFRW